MQEMSSVARYTIVQNTNALEWREKEGGGDFEKF